MVKKSKKPTDFQMFLFEMALALIDLLGKAINDNQVLINKMNAEMNKYRKKNLMIPDRVERENLIKSLTVHNQSMALTRGNITGYIKKYYPGFIKEGGN